MAKARQMPISQITQMTCLLRGCERTFELERGMPEGWVNLITYWSPRPDPSAKLIDVCNSPHLGYDAVLCPEHAQELAGMMKIPPENERSR